jgi:acetate kinase
VRGVGHRIVHGGAKYTGPTIVTPEVLADLRALIPLAPLHQPYNLQAIDAVAERLPDVPQVACFDTSFHRGQPAVAELVALPAEIRDRLRLIHYPDDFDESASVIEPLRQGLCYSVWTDQGGHK